MSDLKSTPKASKEKKDPLHKRLPNFGNYVFIIIYTTIILFFSIIMSGVSAIRNNISNSNYDAVTSIYNRSITQNSPSLNKVTTYNLVAENYDLGVNPKEKFDIITTKSLKNTSIISTDGKVVILADFVKKGLAYQPSFQTKFNTRYILKNESDMKSFISFDFPFPFSSNDAEISNAKLLVDGKEIENAKSLIEVPSAPQVSSIQTRQGLSWEGEVNANSEVEIEVSYDTVGLSSFSYEGLENPNGSQDFKFETKIEGTRAYNIVSGLSVDDRSFDKNEVTLTWDKKDLYNSPSIQVEIGERLNPSTQVSRIYLTLTPLFVIFSLVIVFLTTKFKNGIKVFDLGILSILFTLFFPLVHYLSSFTIDPTNELFFNMNVGYYSMPLYLAFGLSFGIIASITIYLLSRIYDFKFSLRYILPLLVIFIGFFPLVVTIPEYSILLVLFGVVALVVLTIQTRLKLENK